MTLERKCIECHIYSVLNQWLDLCFTYNKLSSTSVCMQWTRYIFKENYFKGIQVSIVRQTE